MKSEHLIEKLVRDKIKPDSLNLSIEEIADSSVNVRKKYICIAINGFNSVGSEY